MQVGCSVDTEKAGYFIPKVSLWVSHFGHMLKPQHFVNTCHRINLECVTRSGTFNEMDTVVKPQQRDETLVSLKLFI